MAVPAEARRIPPISVLDCFPELLLALFRGLSRGSISHGPQIFAASFHTPLCMPQISLFPRILFKHLPPFGNAEFKDCHGITGDYHVALNV